jgi:hypothetical protein
MKAFRIVMPKDPSLNLISGHFFFVDIVGLSEPLLSVKRQIKKIEALNHLISSCKAYRNTGKDSRLVLPTGDGMAIAFLQGPEIPLKLAIELHNKLKVHNKGKSPEEMLRVRIGMNDGPVFVVKDLEGNQNVWGPGIILARRVMDIGDDGHILLTARMAESLRELSDKYKRMIKPLRDYTIKHGKTILLYSLYGNGIGNPNVPTDNSYQKSKMGEEIMKRKLTTIYHSIEVSLRILNPKTMLTRHERVYDIENVSDEPIHEILHGIATDVPKSFIDLKVRAEDQGGNELKIMSINLDKPYQKEFTVSFSSPMRKGENVTYSLEYEVEEPERYLENYFGFNCSKYVMSLGYPSGARFNPVVYDVNVEDGTKSRARSQPVLKEADKLVTATWKRNNVLESQAFRLEW